MKRRRLARWIACAGAAVLIAAAAPAVARPSPGRTASASVVLTVKGPTGSRSYTLAQLKSSFTAYKGYAGYVKTGFVGMEAPHPVKGVRLLDVLKKVGYRSGRVTLRAADGFRYTYSTDWVHGKKVTMYVAAPPRYRKVVMPAANPLTALLAYQDKEPGARVGDPNPWRYYTRTFAGSGSDGLGPLRFWWAYRTWASPGFIQMGWTSMRMVTNVSVAR